MPQIVTLTTDFGIQDGYVAAMKGVILSLKNVHVVDVTHEIPPQDVAAGAYVLHTAYRYFPDGTVHVAVIDPGVGSQRRGLLVETPRYWFVGPDNGLFTPVLQAEKNCRILSLENADLMREVVSATFHGRDVFAPAAGHVCRGADLEAFGPVVDDPVRLNLWDIEEREGALMGRVVHIDRFGNAISNLSRSQVEASVTGSRSWTVEIGGRVFQTLCQTYADVAEGEPLVLYGSQETLELSVCGGNAANEMGVQRGDEWRLCWEGD